MDMLELLLLHGKLMMMGELNLFFVGGGASVPVYLLLTVLGEFRQLENHHVTLCDSFTVTSDLSFQISNKIVVISNK